MNARVRKEIDQLAPTWICAMVLVSLPLHWIQPSFAPGPTVGYGFDPGGFQTLKIVACVLGVLFLSAASFGREFTNGTFQLLLSQPMSRRQLWREKIRVLVSAVVLVWIVFWVSFSSAYGFSIWAGIAGLAFAMGLMGTGLFTTLLLRQVVPALCLSLLIPAISFPAIRFFGDLGFPLWARLGGLVVAAAYAACAYYLARWIFFRAQDLRLGILDFMWFTGREDATTAPVGAVVRRGPGRALASKEIRLQEINLLFGVVTFLVVGALGALFAIQERTAAFDSVEITFALACLLMPVLAGSVAIAEERRLGMLDVQQELPVSRRRQFVVKIAVVYGVALLLGFLLPLLVHFTVAGLTGGHLGDNDFLGFLTGVALTHGFLPGAGVLAVYVLFAATVALYLSSRAQNTPAAIMGTIVVLTAAWVLQVIVLNLEVSDFILYVGMAVVLVALLFRAFSHFPKAASTFWSDLEVMARRVGLGMVALFVLAVTAWGVLDVATGMKLRGAISAWQEAGLPSDIREHLPPPAPEEKNAAVVLADVIYIHRAPYDPERRSDIANRENNALKLADEILSGLETGEVSAESVEELSALLADPEIAERLRVARKSVEYPFFDAYTDYDRGMYITFPHVWGIRQLAAIIQAEAVFQAAQGKWSDAYDSIAVSWRLGELMKDEPLLSPRFQQVTIRSRVFYRLAVFLRAESPDDETLGSWQELLAGSRPAEYFDAAQLDAMVQWQSLKQSFDVGEFKPSEFLPRSRRREWLKSQWLDAAVFRPGHKADIATFININRQRFEIWQQAREGVVRPAALREWEERLEDGFSWYAVVSSESRYGAYASFQSEQQSTAMLELARTALAAHRYREAAGEWPETLGDLVPEYLPEIPRDPIDGEPLRYRRDDDHVVLYSIGPNRTDDGGLEVGRLVSDQPGDSVWVIHQ